MKYIVKLDKGEYLGKDRGDGSEDIVIRESARIFHNHASAKKYVDNLIYNNIGEFDPTNDFPNAQVEMF